MNKVNGPISCGQFSEQTQLSKGFTFNTVVTTIFNKICLELKQKIQKYSYYDIRWLASLMSVNKAVFKEMPKVLSLMPESYRKNFAFSAIRHNYPLVFRVLLDLDLSMTSNFLYSDSYRAIKDFRILTYAVDQGKANIVRMLIQANVDIHYLEPNPLLMTPFMFAISKGHIEIAQMLQRAGADINCWSQGGILQRAFNALSKSCRMDRFREVLKALLQMPGFDINTYKPERGITPLMDIIESLASKELQEEEVNALRLLIQAGADLQVTNFNARDFNGSGYTTLMCAVDSGHPEIVQLILDGLKSTNSPSLSFSKTSDLSHEFRNLRRVKHVLDICRFTKSYGYETALQIAHRLGSDFDRYSKRYISPNKKNNFRIIFKMLLGEHRNVDFKLFVLSKRRFLYG